MASLTLPPAPPNPRQDAIDLHKAFKGPPRHYFPPRVSRPNFRLPHNSSGPAARSCCSIFVFGQILWLNEQEIMLWGMGPETIVAIWLPGGYLIFRACEFGDVSRSWTKLEFPIPGGLAGLGSDGRWGGGRGGFLLLEAYIGH